jgi:hypothetical protein
LINDIIDSGLTAILIKVAAIGIQLYLLLNQAFFLGLLPQKHLGKTLQEVLPTLMKLVRKDII